MKALSLFATGLLAALAAGCAAGPEPAVTPNHPASPRAAEATTPAVATALTTSEPARQPFATGPAAAPSTAAVTYACPHHPEVTSERPGTCPKCGGMKLEPVAKPTSKPAGGAHDHSGHAGPGGDK